MTHVNLFIGGRWIPGEQGDELAVEDPASGAVIGAVAKASPADIDRAADAARTGFASWSAISGQERATVLHRAAALLRERAEDIARAIVSEEGKPLAEATRELAMSADAIDWFGGEARRAYGRVIQPRQPGVSQMVVKEPIGPVAAFTPWNYPVSQAVRKISAALAAGCSIVLKGPEEAPFACAAMVRCFEDAGVAPGAVNLLFGEPSEISERLIAHPAIRKISFTGSTVVGKHLAGLASQEMKRVTLELGGHSPAILFGDADLASAIPLLVALKFDNAGQSCIAPTRFLVHDGIYDRFLERFVAVTADLVVGDGLDPATTMGPLANPRRLAAMDRLVADATAKGGTLLAGGKRIERPGYFYEPTIIADAHEGMDAMNEEPFGPLALIQRFRSFEEVAGEMNRVDYGLATYLFTASSRTAQDIAARVESGMLSINHFGLGLSETPFGGMKASGHGWECGAEAIDAYLTTKFISHLHLDAA